MFIVIIIIIIIIIQGRCVCRIPPTDDAITRLVTFEEYKSRGDRLNVPVLLLILMNNTGGRGN